MFQIIVIVIGIALTLAVAGVGVFYGGSAFTKGASDADAAKVAAQASQIQGAVSLFQSRNSGTLPDDMDALVEGGEYLKSIPVSPYKLNSDKSPIAWVLSNADAKLSLTLAVGTTSVPKDLCNYVKAESGVTCTPTPTTGDATSFELSIAL